MSYLYLKKENGKIVERKMIPSLNARDTASGSVPYFTVDENCFVNRLHIDPASLDDIFKRYYLGEYSYFSESAFNRENAELAEIILNSQDYVSKMLGFIKRSSQADSILKNVFDQIKASQTKKDLRKVLSSLCHGYRVAMNELAQDGKINKSLKKNNGVGIYCLLDENPNAVLAVTIKMVTNAFFEQKFDHMSLEEIDAYAKQSEDGISSEQLLEQLGETFSDTAKENGVDRLAARTMLYQLNSTHLRRLQQQGIESMSANKQKLSCFSCENRSCPVIYSWDKKPIDRFDFVTDAVQVLKTSSTGGELNYDKGIMVFGCEQYATPGNENSPKVLNRKR